MNSIKATIETGPATGGPLGGMNYGIVKGDGEVYLCIGGREYWLSTSAGPDFGPNVTTEFRFGGTSPNVNDEPFNNPNSFFVLSLENLHSFPVWIRFRPVPGASGAFWWLKSARVDVQIGATTESYVFDSPDGIWLGGSDFRGHATGHFCFLRRVPGQDEPNKPNEPPSDCVITLGEPNPQKIGKTGGTVTVAVHANRPECEWAVESMSPNVRIIGAGVGKGSATVVFEVGPSTEKVKVPVGGPLHATVERFVKIAGQYLEFEQYVQVDQIGPLP